MQLYITYHVNNFTCNIPTACYTVFMFARILTAARLQYGNMFQRQKASQIMRKPRQTESKIRRFEGEKNYHENR